VLDEFRCQIGEGSHGDLATVLSGGQVCDNPVIEERMYRIRDVVVVDLPLPSDVVVKFDVEGDAWSVVG
jgi:hypothetical protein